MFIPLLLANIMLLAHSLVPHHHEIACRHAVPAGHDDSRCCRSTAADCCEGRHAEECVQVHEFIRPGDEQRRDGCGFFATDTELPLHYSPEAVLCDAAASYRPPEGDVLRAPRTDAYQISYIALCLGLRAPPVLPA